MSLAAFDIRFPATKRELNFVFGNSANAAVLPMVASDNSRRLNVLLLGFSARRCSDLSEHFLRDMPSVNFSSEAGNLWSIPQRFSSFDTLVINFEAFEDTEIGIDALLAFREENPQVGIVLVSSRVARDEFGGHRKLLCDCTLRYPVTSDRLIEALNVARRREDLA